MNFSHFSRILTFDKLYVTRYDYELLNGLCLSIKCKKGMKIEGKPQVVSNFYTSQRMATSMFRTFSAIYLNEIGQPRSAVA
jgi:hypothetical protein